MANRNNYQEKSSVFNTVLYYTIVVVLIVALFFLYKNYSNHKKLFRDRALEAAQTDSFTDMQIENERQKALEQEKSEEKADASNTSTK